MGNEAINSEQKSNHHLMQELSDKLGHLTAMLTMIYGGGLESFDELNDELKDNYLWACADLAKQTHKMAGSLISAQTR